MTANQGIVGKGGIIAITINGGTVSAMASASTSAAIGTKGWSDTGADITINGGNINASSVGSGISSPASTVRDSDGNSVGLKTITLNNAVSNTAVTSLKDMYGNSINYKLKDVYTTGAELHFYLPDNIIPATITAGGVDYICKDSNLVYYTGHDWSNNDGVCVHCSETCEHKNQTGNTCEVCGKFFHTHEWEYTVDGNEISASCDAAGCPNTNGGSVTLNVADAYYTGSAIGATIEGSFTNGATYKVTYNDSETAPSSVGVHIAKLTVYENGTPKQSVTAEYQISYLEAPNPAYAISGGYPNGATYWCKSGASVTVNAPNGYTVSTALDGIYGSDLSISESDDKVIYLKRTSDGALTNAISIEGICYDGTAATGKITIENRGSWQTLLNKITFGLFFKGDAVATVTATDEGSGIQSIQYYVANTDLINDAALTDTAAITALETAIGVGWSNYNNEIALNKNAKNIVYIKITDNVGNVTYLSSEGIVLYSDAQAVTESVSATYKAGVDKDVTVTLNSNTVKSVVNGTTVLTAGTDYTVSADDKITLKAAYLDTLSIGTYTFNVSYNPLGETYVEASGNEAPMATTFSVCVGAADIANATVNVNGAFTYDGNAKRPDPVVVLNSVTLVKDQDYTVSYSDNVNAGQATVTVTGKGNFAGTATKTFGIAQKEIGIAWGAVSFLPHTGQLVLPAVSATGLADGDTCEVILSVVETVDGAGINPGKWTAKITGLSNGNYKLPENSSLLEVQYTIYANQTAPDVSGIGETVKGKNDGYISGLTTEMEFATEYTNRNDAYTRITDPDMTFASGTYYVRYAAKDYSYASPLTEVTVAEGRELTVILPSASEQIGYTIETDKTTLSYEETVKITIRTREGYSQTRRFTIYNNGVDITDSFVFATNAVTLTNVTEDVKITLKEGSFVDVTDPTAEIAIKDNKWTSFWNDLTFGLFFKETKDVTITATDAGSGINSIHYYLSGREMERDEVRAITDWKAYNGTFKIDPNNNYVIYAKVSDNSGNTVYLNSTGIVLDAVVPIIEGVENGETYYTTQKVTVTEMNVDTITLNGNPVTENITLDSNKETTYTIVVTDKAGNITTAAVTMKPISDFSKPIDTLTKDNVNSGNERVMDGVKAAVAAVDTTNATEAEKQALKDIADKVAALEKVIDDTKAEIARINEERNKYDGDTVNSDDAAALEQLGKDIKALTDGGNLTDVEKTALTEDASAVAAMQKTVADTVAGNDRISNAVGGYDLTTVSSDDQDDLKQLLADIEKQLASTNLTGEEISKLNGDKKAVEDLLTKINGTDQLVEKLTEDADGYSDDTVKSTDTDAIEQIIQDIDALLKTGNLTEDEKKTLEAAKEKAEGLLGTIEDAAKAADTENTVKVKDVTAENVTPENKADLEKAKADLEKALQDKVGNYTEDEKKAIETQIQKINGALTVIANAQAVAATVTTLPQTAEPDDESTIKALDAAMAAYEALTDYEKSLLDPKVKTKLDALSAALRNYDIVEGDGAMLTDKDSGLRFVANGWFNKFIGIKVNGQVVDAKHYEVKSGSTIITVKASYLKTLPAGEYTITVLYTDGETDGTFHIMQETVTPPTGDEQPLMLWLAVLLVSGAVLLTLAYKKRTGKKA